MNHTKIAVDIFDKFAKEYQEKFMNLDLYNDTFDFFCEQVQTKNAHILELACGPGNITKYLLSKRANFKILATDLSNNMLELAKLNNPTAQFKLMDCRDVKKLNKKFDALIAGFCLPYLSKAEAIQLIAHAAESLKPKGILYLSTMEDDNHKSGFKTGSTGEQMFMNYHEEIYLREAMQENNLKLLKLYRKNFPSTDGSKVIDLILIAEKI